MKKNGLTLMLVVCTFFPFTLGKNQSFCVFISFHYEYHFLTAPWGILKNSGQAGAE